MPQRKLGATPIFFCWLPQLLASCASALMRKAESWPVWKLKSPVMRFMPPVPTVAFTSCWFIRKGCLLTWLTTPPVEPLPNSIDAEPLITSTRSSLNVSRSYSAPSRMPSR